MTIPSLLSPIDQTERIHILDILRGFAVFGILLVNITGFNDPVFYPERIPSQGFPWYDELFDFLMVFLAEGKFYTIFSFLFGLGFSVQITRARKKRHGYPLILYAAFADFVWIWASACRLVLDERYSPALCLTRIYLAMVSKTIKSCLVVFGCDLHGFLVPLHGADWRSGRR